MRTGTFSDMEMVEGDLVGSELRVACTSKGYQGVFQVAEGVPSELYVVRLSFSHDSLAFAVLEGEYAGSFRGVVERDSLKGVLRFRNGGAMPIVLPRRRSYWDR